MAGQHRDDVTDPTLSVRSGESASRETAIEAPNRTRRPTMDLVTRGSLIGRYVVIDQLGAGGMGIVYAAYDPELDRRVALKLVHPGPGGSKGGATRIQREAQALARLSHPNVVAIFDVGTIDDRVFLAMELAPGDTLADWLAGANRSWREVLAVFAAAGQGLAAAHDAGVVHRDFKPSNVIVGSDRRVRVLDFGLARGAGDAPEIREPAGTEAPHGVLSVELTQAGSLLGTPVYMSPEAYRGEVVTAAGDQFSFCVALHEALYGERPFDHMFEARLPPVTPAPAETEVPAWVRRIVLKGLEARTTDRFASMNELLAALADDPAVKRRKWLMATGATLALAGLVFGGVAWHKASATDDPCAVDAPLAGTWDSIHRTRVRTAFAMTHLPEADPSFTRTARALDELSKSWTGARVEACAETRDRHTQPEAGLMLRLACLDHQKEDLAALVSLLEHADGAIVKEAAQAVHELPGPAVCANARSLSYVDPPPPAVRARVGDLRRGVSGALALLLAGKEREAGERLRSLVVEVRQVGYQPLLAETLYVLGRQELDDFASAIHHLDEAELVAVAARVDEIAARAAAMRLTEGAIAGREDDVLRAWSDRARAWVQRDGDLEAEFGLEESLGILAENKGDHASAEGHFRRAIVVGTSVFGDASTRVFGVEGTMAMSLIQLGRHEEAAAMLGPAIETFERAYGDSSVRLRDALDNYGLALAMIGRYAEARKALERALAMGSGADLTHGALLCDLARVALADGKIDDAIDSGQRGVAQIKALHVEKGNLAINEDPLAAAYAAAGRAGDALAQTQECLAEFTKAGNDGIDNVPCLGIEGSALVDLARPDEGRSVLDRALRLQNGHPAAPGVIASLQFQLARAIVASGGDRERAKDLVNHARDELARYPFKKRALEEVEAWRARSSLP